MRLDRRCANRDSRPTRGLLAVGSLSCAVAAFADVCDRTQAVQDAILASVDVTACEDVTEKHLEDVTDLHLGDRSIGELTSGDFAGLVRVKTLDLSGNDLARLPEGVFDPLVMLHTLHLGNNDLTSLPDAIFTRLTFLDTLTLHGNYLTELPQFHALEPLHRTGLGEEAGQVPRGVAMLEAFLEETGAESVEDFVRALPDIFRQRFVMVFDSGGLGAEFVDRENPRVVMHGAGADILFSITTNPNADAKFRSSVEFLLLERVDSDEWVAGVIDFRDPEPRIVQPDGCASCHGSIHKPLWGEMDRTSARRPVLQGTEGESPVRTGAKDALVRLVEDKTNARVNLFDFREAPVRSRTRRIYRGGGQEVGRELSSLVAWAHSRVLFNRYLDGNDDRIESVVCDDDMRGQVGSKINDLVPASLLDPSELSTGERIQSPGSSSAPFAYNNYARMQDTAVIVLLADVYDRVPEVRDFYRRTTNSEIITGSKFNRYDQPRDADKRFLFYPPDTASAKDELLQFLRLHFGRSTRKTLDDRKEDYNGFAFVVMSQGHVNHIAYRVCDVLETLPDVDAGADQWVEPGEMATLSGKGTAADGGELKFVWRQVGGTAVALADSNEAEATFIAPVDLDSGTVLVFELTATDVGGLSSSDATAVTVETDVVTVMPPGYGSGPNAGLVNVPSRHRRGDVTP